MMSACVCVCACLHALLPRGTYEVQVSGVCASDHHLLFFFFFFFNPHHAHNSLTSFSPRGCGCLSCATPLSDLWSAILTPTLRLPHRAGNQITLPPTTVIATIMADEYAYLEPDFDPSTLTMPKLRSILVAHNVAYPSSAKKPELVGLFNDNVASQARALKSARSRTVRSSRGIVDVPSIQASTVDEDEAPPAPPTARRPSRRTTRSRPEERAESPPEVVARTPATVKRPSSRHSRLQGDGLDGADDSARLASVRKTRQSVPSAVTRQLEPEPEAVYPQGSESPFTSDNPFQSGSSPPSALRGKSSEARRTTLGPAKERTKSRETRRRTDGYTARDEDGTVSHSFEMPVARVKQQLPKDEEEAAEIAAGEEFTPEEQLDLVRSRAQNGERDILPPRRKKQPKKTGVSRAAPWTVLVAMLGGIATVWRQEKINVGYCGVGEPSTALAGVEIPEWASFIQPQCEPCPQHAYCYEGLRTTCEQDFVLTPHPLSLGGLVPLAPTCEPDSDKVRKIKAVADHAVDNELRVRNAQYECGEIKSPDISEEELKQVVSAKRSRKMTDEEFNDLWEPAINEMLGREEVVSKVEG